MLTTTRSKTRIIKHLVRLITCHSYSSSITIPANSYFNHPNPAAFTQLLSQRPPISILKQLHAKIITLSLSSHFSLVHSLIQCYLSTKNLTSARSLFNRYPSPSPPILIWNLMIRAYSKLAHSAVPITLFRQLIDLEVVPDNYTFTFLITSCSHQLSELQGVIAHGMVIKNGCMMNLYVGNSLINLYSVFTEMDCAWKVFDEMLNRDIFSWTSLVRGYAKSGEMGEACRLFHNMPVHNEVSWTVIISGFVGAERFIEALKYFNDLLINDGHVKPSEAVLVCALSACAHLGALDQGKWIHVYIDKYGIVESSNISTALIDMYSKCGKIECASRVFNEISQPDVLNYTSIISGFSIHGLGQDALRVFNQMLADNVSPNEVTIIVVLNGCSHAGLVDEGSSIFNNMEYSWRIVPKLEHYGCYVDLLARAGYLERAFGIVKNMPLEPDIVIWRALLSACRVHRDINVAEQVINHIEQLESSICDGGEVILSNLYASMSIWDRVYQVRKLMSKRKNDSKPACSLIEVKGVVHEFRVDDQMHPDIGNIRDKLNEILKRARLGGYAASSMQGSFDLIEEEKEQAVARHSEKLAVAFGLINTEPGSCIRIIKNLRTCEDCHSALKAISKVFEREIIVRDRSRFHTFKEGKCSCNEYW